MRKLAFVLLTTAVTIGNVWSQTENKEKNNSNGKDGDTKIINGIECVFVKAGTFMMGSPTGEMGRESDETQHEVALTQDFWISKYEITNAQYGKSDNPNNANYPVVNVTWNQASAFAKSKGARLPSEAEWEFAARGGNKSNKYIYSGGNNLDEVGWYKNNISTATADNSGLKTQVVGKKSPNELGIYDMSGNVYEWCSDWYGKYSAASLPTKQSEQISPVGPSTGITRVIRGGGWNQNARYCRVAYRDDRGPSYSDLSIGFRVVFPAN